MPVLSRGPAFVRGRGKGLTGGVLTAQNAIVYSSNQTLIFAYGSSPINLDSLTATDQTLTYNYS